MKVITEQDEFELARPTQTPDTNDSLTNEESIALKLLLGWQGIATNKQILGMLNNADDASIENYISAQILQEKQNKINGTKIIVSNKKIVIDRQKIIRAFLEVTGIDLEA